MIVLDGPIGTRLEAMGIPTPAPLWSAAALESHPDAVAALHAEYAAAGAVVHTAATFRTTPRAAGAAWRALMRRAVALARGAVPAGHRVAGSIAPLEDCWHPERSPADPRPEHRELARALAEGVDLLLVETFLHPGEALVAVEEAVATGLPTWVAFSAGWRGDRMDPETMGRAAREAARRGAVAVLVNCTPATATLPYVRAIAGCGVAIGAYANAGPPEDALADGVPGAAARYAEIAATWIAAGATIVGSCCETGTPHVRALAAR